MLILTGDTRSACNLAVLEERRWGRMCVAKTPKPYPYEPWGFDCRAFPAWQQVGCPIGLTQDSWAMLWDADDFEQWLETCRNVAMPPRIAVCPDIPGSMESLEWSLMWRESLPSDWPWYLALQDGMTPEAVTDVAHLFTGFFLGGSDAFKLTAQGWCDLAHFCGKKFHYARAGTRKKLQHAYAVGADSLDSSYPLWTKHRFWQFGQWVDGLGLQETFEFAGVRDLSI
jgi:hypothetical protein